MPGPFALQTQRLFHVFCEGIQFGGVFIGQGEFPDCLNVLGGLTQGGNLGKDRTLRFRQGQRPVAGAHHVAGRALVDHCVIHIHQAVNGMLIQQIDQLQRLGNRQRVGF